MPDYYYLLRITPISIRFVCVGPVKTSPPYFLKKWYESLFLRNLPRSFADVSDPAIAPAASVFPSMPSVPTETMTVFLFGLFKFFSMYKTNSWFLPPFPFPFTVTVVSPPKITQPLLPLRNIFVIFTEALSTLPEIGCTTLIEKPSFLAFLAITPRQFLLLDITQFPILSTFGVSEIS